MRSGIHGRRAASFAIVLGSLALANCGGGGGGAAPAVPAVPPNLSGASINGTFDHGATVTVSGGSAFGQKAPALPVVLDGASWTSIADKWDGFWPDQNADPTYNLRYRNLPGLSPRPHDRHNGRYIAGAHYPNAVFDASAGPNVIFWKNRTITSYPAYTYASWYQRMDTAWVFQDGLTPDTDNNLKNFAFSVCCSPYELPRNWYISYNEGPHNAGQTSNWIIGDDFVPPSGPGSIQDPDLNNHNSFWGIYVNPMNMGGTWSKIEVEIKYSNQPDGYIKMWENGVLKINHRGYNDRLPGHQRTEGIGGFARSRNTANWRYFADVYLDYSPARVVLANSPTLSSATVVESQIPTGWSDGSITFVVNLGKFAQGQTAYLFVVNTAGLPSNPGVPVLVAN